MILAVRYLTGWWSWSISKDLELTRTIRQIQWQLVFKIMAAVDHNLAKDWGANSIDSKIRWTHGNCFASFAARSGCACEERFPIFTTKSLWAICSRLELESRNKATSIQWCHLRAGTENHLDMNSIQLKRKARASNQRSFFKGARELMPLWANLETAWL